MATQSQNITDYPNNNTIFSVWKFKEGTDYKPVFERLCALVSNLNHSFVVRIPEGRTSCIMGIGYEAWKKLGMPTPLPKELKTFEPIAGAKHTAISTEGDAEIKSNEMGTKYIVPYGLYRCEGYVSATLARKSTGFSGEDLNLFWDAVVNMFEHDHSAARWQMALRELIVFKHESELGNAPAHKLFDLVTVNRREGAPSPTRSYADYEVEIDLDALPQSHLNKLLLSGIISLVRRKNPASIFFKGAEHGRGFGIHFRLN